MADYCTTTFMKTFNQHRTYDTTNKPTLAVIASWIPTVSAEMDARFGGVGITVPITTSPTHPAYLYVKQIAAMGVACITERSVTGGGRKNTDSGYINWCNEYEKKMKAIEANTAILTGLISGVVTASFDSYEYSNSDQRRDADNEPFDRDETLW